MIVTRRCSICRDELPLNRSHFFRDARKPHSLSYRCKSCDVAKVRQWRQRQRERIRRLEK